MAVNVSDRAVAWLNIGVKVTRARMKILGIPFGKKVEIISLPLGIPLDAMAPRPTNSRSESLNLYNQMQNDLLAEVQKMADSLGKGESKMLDLKVQLRKA